MNSIIKVYNLSLGEAINTRGANVANDAALEELSQIIEKGCLMPMDRLTIKKLKADKQLVPPSKFFLKVKYLLAGTFDKFNARLAGGGHRQSHDDYEKHIITSSCHIISTYGGGKIGQTRECEDDD